jgi:hypothetical protein
MGFDTEEQLIGYEAAFPVAKGGKQCYKYAL